MILRRKPVQQGLTERERKVARFLSEGLMNAEIAAQVGISRHTVKNTVHSLLNKSGMGDRLELALWWLVHGEQQ